MKRAERLSICARVLHDAAAEHLDPTKTALFLWGSLLGADFSPESSDVDVLLIGAERADVLTAERLRQSAHSSGSFLTRLDLTVTSLDALRGGRRKRPFDRISPAIVFFQSDEWRLVFGNEDLLSAVRSRLLPARRQLQLRTAALQRRLRIHAADPADEPITYILKELGFVCHALHQLTSVPRSFSYAGLALDATPATRDAVEALLAARARNWHDIDAETILSLAGDVIAHVQSACVASLVEDAGASEV